MIGKAKAISHGANLLRYISGESRKKCDADDRIMRIADNLLEGMDATSMWESMGLTCNSHSKMQNTIIRIELSPSKENTKNFNDMDWRNLWNEYLEVFDGIELKDREGNVTSPCTSLRNSRYTVWLHKDSKSGIPHIHAAVCRVDENGYTNNDRNIHLRAIRAAEIVSKRRGWQVASSIHGERLAEVSNLCLDILRKMPEWSWNGYVKSLAENGWTVGERRNGSGDLCGYALKNGDVKYKASELGTRRNLMAKNIEATWNKLHQQDKQRQTMENTFAHTGTMHINDDIQLSLRIPDYHVYMKYQNDHIPFYLEHRGESCRFFIPDNIHSLFNDVFSWRDYENSDDLIDKAIALFVGLTIPPADFHVGTGGGDITDSHGWGRDPEEDDVEWAKRCARAALRVIKPRHRKSGGIHR